uniref:Peptidase A1 domain-containing protein n=1 Tax=Oryza glumipatula TaxID=40148 RepID=A0A0E0AIY5_9ORYZ
MVLSDVASESAWDPRGPHMSECQLRGAASLGRRFSYCLIPHSVNISSALNFGALANVTVPGAASTPLVAGDVETYYTMVLDSVEVGNKTVASVASSRIVMDSGTTLTFLDPALMGPLVDELSHRCSRRTGCCSCATSCPGGRWKPERESQITSINISRSPDTPSWNLVQIITVIM